MFRKYQVLFSIQLAHQYYVDGKSRDFELQPTQACAGLLRNFGLLFKKTEDGGIVLFERSAASKADPGEVIRKIKEEVIFTFTLKLKQYSFPNYTQLGEQPVARVGKNIYYFSNVDQDTGAVNQNLDTGGAVRLTVQEEAGEADLCTLTPQIFTLPADGYSAIGVFRTSIGQPPKAVLLAQAREDPDSIALDFRSFPAGKYQLGWFDLPTGAGLDDVVLETGTPRKDIFLDSRLIGRAPLGVIQIALDEAHVHYDDPPPVFLLEFKRAWKQWKYYLISEEGFSSDLAITYDFDTDTHNPVYPETILFDRVDITDMTPEELATVQSFVPKEVLLFRSREDQLLPAYEEPLAGLQLIDQNVSTGSVKVELDNLPNPAVHAIKAELFITL